MSTDDRRVTGATEDTKRAGICLDKLIIPRKEDLANKDSDAFVVDINYTYQPFQNSPENSLIVCIEQSYIQYAGSYRENCRDCLVSYLSGVPCGLM